MEGEAGRQQQQPEGEAAAAKEEAFRRGGGARCVTEGRERRQRDNGW